MNEYLMRAYLKSRKGADDEEFIRKMRRALSSDRYLDRDYRRDIDYGYAKDREYDPIYMNRHSEPQLSDIIDELDYSDKDRLFRMLLENEEGTTYNNFNDSTAKYLVSQMYHSSGGKKYVGEKYDMSKAKEVCEKYRGIISKNITPADVYIALNAQYHDYCELFKAWFGDNIDTKVIESAVNFWFKDDDYKGVNKVYKYFREA